MQTSFQIIFSSTMALVWGREINGQNELSTGLKEASIKEEGLDDSVKQEVSADSSD